MEHLENINQIINTHKTNMIKSDYKSSMNVINNLTKNMLSRKIPHKLLTKYFIIFINTIENIKNELRDADYLLFMNSLKEINTFMTFKKDRLSDYDEEEDNYYNYEEDNNDNDNEEDNCIIDMDELLQVIDSNNSIIMNFIQENNLPNDFLNSVFNISNKAAYNYLYYGACSCDDDIISCNMNCNNYLKCKNIQKYILNYPLNFIIYNEYNYNDYIRIVEDIKKYNLFSFDGKINDKFNIEYIMDESKMNKNIIKNIINQIELQSNNLSYNNQVIQFINIISIIFQKEYHLLTNPNLRQAIYSKLMVQFNNETVIEVIHYWANKLNFNPNIIEIITSSIFKYFPE